MINSVQESDIPMEESRRDSFKLDKNEILNTDDKLKRK